MASMAEQWAGVEGVVSSQEQERLGKAFRLMANAYMDGPWARPPQAVLAELQELDPWLLQDYLQQLGWDVIGGYGSIGTAERQRAVQESRRLWKYSPMAQWSIWLWTSWGLGESVKVTLDNEKADEMFQEFWTGDRNQAVLADDCIHDLSNWLLADGNQFLAYYADTVEGEPTVTEIDPEEIKEIVTHPENSKRPLFYKRVWTDNTTNATGQALSQTWYYPDWQAFLSGALDEEYKGTGKTLAETVLPVNAIRADTGQRVGDGVQTLGGDEVTTTVCVQHIHHNHKERGSLWGWPLLATGSSWMKAHKRFMEAQLAVVESKAQFVRRYKVKGGSRAVDYVKGVIASNLSQSSSTYDTNPPNAPGGSEIMNQSTDVDDLPMTTGAGDARTNNGLFAWYSLLGAGLFPASAGLDLQRYATALEMDKTQSMLFSQYQTFWAAQFKRMVRIVVGMREKFGGASFGEYTVDVSVDSLSLADFPAVAKTLGPLVGQMLTPLEADGTMPVEAGRKIAAELWRVVLQALGSTRASELASDEAFEPPEEEVPEEPMPEVPEEEPPALEGPEGAEEEPGVVEAIADMILANVRAGTVTLGQVAEWTVGTIDDMGEGE